MELGGSRTEDNSSVNSVRGAKSETEAHSRADSKDSGTGAETEIRNNSGLNLEGRVRSGTDADLNTKSNVWRTRAESEPVAVRAGCLGMASVSSMDETVTADCLRVEAITGSTSSSGMIWTAKCNDI